MWFNEWYRQLQGQSATGPRTRRTPSTRATVRLRLQELEDRTLLSSYSAATVSDLITAINAANSAGGTNTITLTAATSSPYVLTAVNNSTDGPTGLPVITGGRKPDILTFVGNGDIIERSTASGTPDFRLSGVANGASLILENLTLQNGLEVGSGNAADGGAVYNQGTLVLSGVTVQDNIAQGSTGSVQNTGKGAAPGNDAQGGGIWSNGSLTVENSTLIQNNQAIGGNGFFGETGPFRSSRIASSNGGNGWGGGLYVSGGTVTLTGSTVDNNSAQGGESGEYNVVSAANGGNGNGGGLCVVSGAVTLSGDTVDGNQAVGGADNTSDISSGGNGYGGGVYVAGDTVALSSDIVDSNQAVGGAVVLTGASLRNSGSGYGGGLYVAGGTVTLCSDTVQSNAAKAGAVVGSTSNGTSGHGFGGGLFIAPKDKNVSIFMPSLISNNTADIDPNIDGSFTTLQNC
jgi:hypothetical protein